MKKISLIYLLICFFITSSSIAVTSKKASLVVDMHNGKVLHSNMANEPRYPASLVKMMTIYIAFKKINSGELSLDKKLLVSSKAAAMPRTNMALKAGSYIPARKAILGLIVHSANDAAVVLAEGIAGSEAKFVTLMNEQAKKLGMNNTTYYNSSGWIHKKQKTTAHDQAKLAIALKRDFPQFFPWFSVTSFNFNGKTYKSHNRVLSQYKGATGLKTGFINDSGFNITTTAQKNGKHLVGVVMGGNTAKERDKLVMSLLDQGFAKVSTAPKVDKKVNKKSNKK
jgi:D-alanyl-D-alanine carboxypeptidase (penicillin-binding protein 5/6)